MRIIIVFRVRDISFRNSETFSSMNVVHFFLQSIDDESDFDMAPMFSHLALVFMRKKNVKLQCFPRRCSIFVMFVNLTGYNVMLSMFYVLNL